MTNLQLTGYSGSELHTLDVARALAEQGSDVTVATLAAAQPLQQLFDDAGIRIVEYPHFAELAGSYELFFAQHHVVADAVAMREDVQFSKCAISSLGPTSLHEAIPQFACTDDVYVFVSDECRDARQPELPQGASHVLVFPNYPHEDFLRLPTRAYPTHPRRVAIVSNHPPQELIEATSLDSDIAFDVFGWNSMAQLADARTLAPYDAIVAIGRTCLDAFAGRIPLYCYDHFGGPGYIRPADAPLHAAANFSGRSDPARLSASELINSIRGGYAQAVADLDELHDYACRVHNFDAHLDELLQALADAPACAHTRTRGLEQQCELVCQTLRSHILGSLGTAQFFYGQEGDAESEECSIYVPYRYHTRITIDCSRFNLGAGHRILRFDPDTKPCQCTLMHTHLDAYGGISRGGGTTDFHTPDPCYRPSHPLPTDTTLSFCTTELSLHDAATYNEALRHDMENSRAEVRAAQAECARLSDEVRRYAQLVDDERFRHESVRWTARNLGRLGAQRARTALERFRG